MFLAYATRISNIHTLWFSYASNWYMWFNEKEIAGWVQRVSRIFRMFLRLNTPSTFICIAPIANGTHLFHLLYLDQAHVLEHHDDSRLYIICLSWKWILSSSLNKYVGSCKNITLSGKGVIWYWKWQIIYSLHSKQNINQSQWIEWKEKWCTANDSNKFNNNLVSNYVYLGSDECVYVSECARTF